MDLANVESELRERGLVLTPQRRSIVDYLSRTCSHPTAAEIHAATGAGSLSTVYNTLALLEEIGLVRELRERGAESRYDPNTEAHHHLRCVECGRLHDIDASQVQVMSSVVYRTVQVCFEGHCPDGCVSA